MGRVGWVGNCPLKVLGNRMIVSGGFPIYCLPNQIINASYATTEKGNNRNRTMRLMVLYTMYYNLPYLCPETCRDRKTRADCVNPKG